MIPTTKIKPIKKGDAREFNNSNIEIVMSVDKKLQKYKSIILDPYESKKYICGPNEIKHWYETKYVRFYYDEV